MKDFLKSALGAVLGAGLVIGLIGGASIALADRVTTGGGTVSSIGVSSAGGTLTIGSTPVTTSGTITAAINLAHANIWTGLQSFLNASSSLSSHTNTAYFGAIATSTINADGKGSIVLPASGSFTLGSNGVNTGKFGIGTTSPTFGFTIASTTSAGTHENILTGTSTTYTITPANGPVQLYRTGISATTFSAAGFIIGTKVDFTVCNPGGSAGALTWSGFHTYGTAPSQTTTADQCDKYVVGMTAATSSPNGIMYYAQAGAGLQ